MRIRVRFEKTGPIRFVGHLDFMRTFQKIIKKSGLAAVYTAGFNPHMVLSFADPLGVGQESCGEYADIEFAYRDSAALTEQELYRLQDIGLRNEELPPAPSSRELLAALNAASVDGIRFTGAVRVGLIRSSKAMALVRYAAWQILLTDSFLEAQNPELPVAILEFLAQESIVIHKVTKKAEKDVDIRPQILSLQTEEAEAFPAVAAEPCFTRRRSLLLLCASGSNGNVKPQTVMEALCAFCGSPFDESAFRLVRRELYDEKRRPLLSLGAALQ